MFDNTKIEFEMICEDILNNAKFKSLNKELHHGITRYDHCMHVAKTTHFLLKSFHSKKISEVTQAALLHDFYNDNELSDYNAVKKLSAHPKVALDNAKEYFELSDIQEDIIVNHMFPKTKSLPKSKESCLVSVVDKIVAVYEMLHYKTVMQIGVMLFFVVNIMNIHN